MTLDLVLATSALLVVAGAITRLMSRASAASRHLVWTAALLAVIAMPAARLWLPAIDLPVLSPTAAPNEQPLPEKRDRDSFFPEIRQDNPNTVSKLETRFSQENESRSLFAPVWLAGIAGILLWYAAGTIGVWRLARRSARGPACLHESATFSARAAGITRPIQVRISADDRVPMTWGLLRPTVLLPSKWREWPDDRLDTVLAHEIAHAARFDVAAHRIARAAAALHWFNPLVWLAMREAQLERERACDDVVLRRGAEASAYAGELVTFARTLSPTAAALPMARRSRLEARVMAILDPRTNRKGTSVVVAVLAVLFVVAAGVASVIRLSAYDLPPLPERASFAAERSTDTWTRTDFSGTWVAINPDIEKLADSYFRAGTSSAPASFTIAQDSRNMIFVRHSARQDIASTYPVNGFSFTNVLSPLHKTEKGLGTWQSGRFVVGFNNGDFLVFSMKDGGILRLDQTDIRPLLFRKVAPPQSMPPPPPPPPPAPPAPKSEIQVTSAQQSETAKCAEERARAAAAGWDVTNLSLLCEAGLKQPRRIHDARPLYTPEAMRERIEGVVGLQGVIDVNGRIREPRVTKSLDKVYGLDEQARKTVEAMAFEPATKDGKPVRVLVDIDLMFALSPLPPPPYKAPPPQPGAQNPPPPPPPAPRLGTPEAARLARCEWEQDQAVKAGWDLTNVHLPCEAGVEPPIRTRAVNAAYTPEAMRAKIQGFVKIQAVVDVDGVVREVKVAQSLDRVFGLDEQALKAVRAMTFAPGKFKGQPARVLMYFDMPFALR